MLNKPLHSDAPEHYSNDVSVDVLLGGDNPFPGLRPFSVEDSHLFFGREGQIDDILVKISKNRFITVMGYSGSGKSSLMFCGLVPVLYGGFITDSGSQWNIITTRPGSSPIRSLTESIIEFMIRTNRIAQLSPPERLAPAQPAWQVDIVGQLALALAQILADRAHARRISVLGAGDVGQRLLVAGVAG